MAKVVSFLKHMAFLYRGAVPSSSSTREGQPPQHLSGAFSILLLLLPLSTVHSPLQPKASLSFSFQPKI